MLASLAAVRAAGTNASQVSSNLTSLLKETSVVYSNLKPYEAHQLRAAILLTVADVGPTPDVLPTVLDELANATPSASLAAAVRAAGALPANSPQIIPRLCDLLGRAALTPLSI